MTFCPCGSQKKFDLCCGLYLQQGQLPQTPEQLMRSRYTAYCLKQFEYIKKTMLGKPLIGFDLVEIQQSMQHITWIKLTVNQAYLDGPYRGFVDFVAHYLARNQLMTLSELSEFHRVDGRWFYVDGTVSKTTPLPQNQKIMKSHPCPCGSGKKFKNCHEK